MPVQYKFGPIIQTLTRDMLYPGRWFKIRKDCDEEPKLQVLADLDNIWIVTAVDEKLGAVSCFDASSKPCYPDLWIDIDLLLKWGYVDAETKFYEPPNN